MTNSPQMNAQNTGHSYSRYLVHYRTLDNIWLQFRLISPNCIDFLIRLGDMYHGKSLKRWDS